LTPDFSPRRIGATSTSVSPITLGTMRLGNAADAEALLADAFGLGITSLHCSSEYETYPLFRDAFRNLRGTAPADLTVIAKVAAPHFGEDRFVAADFRSKVQFYLDTLGLETLGVVQWLLRHDLKDEAARARIFDAAQDEVAEVVQDLKGRGMIGACVGFPYTAPIAKRLVAANFMDGLAVYVNPLEHEMDEFVAAAAAKGKSTIAIRPFAAGRLFRESPLNPVEALNYVFNMPGIAAAVVSASSVEHLEQLRACFPGSPVALMPPSASEPIG
jgi:aryl-alcohol dehydrogenase-like predicted oxidoreductase